LSNIIAIIVAGGSGNRFCDPLPKQYHKINGKYIINKSIEAFRGIVDKIIVVIRLEDLEHAQTIIENVDIVIGGETRQLSTLKGLEYAAQYNPSKILIHDACRPFVSQKLVKSVIEELDKHEFVLPAIKIADTLKQTNGNFVIKTWDREDFILAQTPQGFKYSNAILDLYSNTSFSYTDDAGLFEQAGKRVYIIDGEITNKKITYKEDL